MRDLLTIIAAALLLALGAVWVAPAYIDWQGWRTEIDRTLSEAAGIPVTSHGAIRLSVLPSPYLSIAGVAVGRSATSRMQIEQLQLGVGLMPLLSGRIQVRSTRLEGVEAIMQLATDGTLVLPQSDGATRPASFDSIEVMRATLTVIRDRVPLATAVPLALEASSPARNGPWRIAGEIGGRPVRIATGEAINGQTRLRVALPPVSAPGIETDGQLNFSGGKLAYSGSWLVRNTGDPAATGSASGRFTLDPAQLALAEIALEWGPTEALPIANRVTGDLTLPLDGVRPGTLNLTTRRLDLGPLTQPVLPPQLGWLNVMPVSPGAITVKASTDQLMIGGEEVTRVSLSGALANRALTLANLSGRFAGLDVVATGRIEDGTASLDTTLSASETARLALALSRMGLSPALADVVGAQGQVRATGRIGLAGGQFSLTGWRGSSGGTTWSLDANHAGGATEVDLKGERFNLDGLPTLAGLAELEKLSARISLTGARIGTTRGDVRAEVTQDGSTLIIRQLVANGFGGLSLQGQGTLGGAGTAFDLRLDAPQAQPAITLLAPLLPPGLSQRLLAQPALISPLALTGRLAQTATGNTLAAGGIAGTMRVGLSGAASSAGEVSQIRLSLDNATSATAAALIGWPAPQQMTGALQITAARDGNALSLRASAPGLSLAGEAPWPTNAAPLVIGLTVAADSLARLLPAPLAAMLEGGAVAGTARLQRGPEGWALGDIRATGQTTSLGTLTWGDNRTLTGQLSLVTLDASRVTAAALGAETLIDASSNWTTQRLRDGLTPFTGEIMLNAGQFRFSEWLAAGPAKLTLKFAPDETRVEAVAVAVGRGAIAGSARLARAGGLGSVAADLSFRDLDAGMLSGGALTGSISGKLLAGGAGETPARIVASLGGQGSLAGTGLSVMGVAGDALTRTMAANPDDIIDANRLSRILGAALSSGNLPLPLSQQPLTLTAGTLRVAVPPASSGGTNLDGSAQIDLRNLTLEARLRLAMSERPRGWTGPLPQTVIAWRGPILTPARQIDSTTLLNGLAQRRLREELERVEAFEADLRERSFFARRLRVEREMNARPVPQAEEPVFSPGLLPELPAPLQITPMPLPLSRQPQRP